MTQSKTIPTHKVAVNAVRQHLETLRAAGKTILILGGGIGGVVAASRLRQGYARPHRHNGHLREKGVIFFREVANTIQKRKASYETGLFVTAGFS